MQIANTLCVNTTLQAIVLSDNQFRIDDTIRVLILL